VPKNQTKKPLTQHETLGLELGFGQGCLDRLPNPLPNPRLHPNPRRINTPISFALSVCLSPRHFQCVSPIIFSIFSLFYFDNFHLKLVSLRQWKFSFFFIWYVGSGSNDRRNRNAQNQIEIEKLCTFLRAFLGCEWSAGFCFCFGLFWFRFRCLDTQIIHLRVNETLSLVKSRSSRRPNLGDLEMLRSQIPGCLRSWTRAPTIFLFRFS